MKKLLAILLSAVMVLGLLAGCAQEEPQTTEQIPETTAAPTEETQPADPVELHVWVREGERDWLAGQFAEFQKLHPEWNLSLRDGVCTDADAVKMAMTDPDAAADLYFFSGDQMEALMQTNALAQLGGIYLEAVREENGQTMLGCMTAADGGVYGVPMTGDSWILYYNRSVYEDADVSSLEVLLKNGKVAIPLEEPDCLAAFYGISGSFYGETGADEQAGIELGEQAAEITAYLAKLADHENFVSETGEELEKVLKDGTVSAVFGKTQDAEKIRQLLGENFGAARLPAIFLGGEAVRLTPFVTAGAIGVNPNSTFPQAAVAFAVHLGSAEAQLARWEQTGVRPCAAGTAEALEENPVAAAFADTAAENSMPFPRTTRMAEQGKPARMLGEALTEGRITADNAEDKIQDLQEYLKPEES